MLYGLLDHRIGDLYVFSLAGIINHYLQHIEQFAGITS
jgi:hypothetical protein